MQGLSEEVFGGWAIKVNSAIEVVMTAAAALVSLAAAVSLLGDLFPILRTPVVWRITGQDLLACGIALGMTWVVNNRPRLLSLTYRPATLGILVVLWGMTLAAVLTGGLRLPAFDNVDVYPLLARLLRVRPEPNDGNPEITLPLLRADRDFTPITR